jgi:hypothetical protein
MCHRHILPYLANPLRSDFSAMISFAFSRPHKSITVATAAPARTHGTASMVVAGSTVFSFDYLFLHCDCLPSKLLRRASRRTGMGHGRLIANCCHGIFSFIIDAEKKHERSSQAHVLRKR